MQVIADLQLHSRFARAVSKEMTIPNLHAWSRRKGIGLIATGDWTHPLWMREIEENLEELGNGLLILKNQDPIRQLADKNQIETRGVFECENPLFLLATEVSCIYSQGGKVRRVHTLIWVPTLASAQKINHELTKRGCNLMSDGRPIIGLTSIQVAELVFTIEPLALIIPAHAWTPWFAVYGSLGGFDSLKEAFGPYADRIYAIETGLSSNPSMNWQVPELDTRSIVSFSDAHSGPKLGREATVFALNELSYAAIREAIMLPSVDITHVSARGAQNHIAYTIEFYPEEGKYHYTGHRTCNVRYTPEETKKNGTTCPVCGKGLTVGVMERVEALAGRTADDVGSVRTDVEMVQGGATVSMIRSSTFQDRPHFVMMVPLLEIIAECLGRPTSSTRCQALYDEMLHRLGSEFTILLTRELSEIEQTAGPRIAEGIGRVRKGTVYIDPGYDGVFGIVKLWKENEDKPLIDATKEQLRIFD